MERVTARDPRVPAPTGDRFSPNLVKTLQNSFVYLLIGVVRGRYTHLLRKSQIKGCRGETPGWSVSGVKNPVSWDLSEGKPRVVF